VISDANATSGISRLEFTGAWRYDKYDDVGSTTNPKIGFNYSPVKSLSFHGSYGTSFRAPLITEIYGNSNALYGEYYQNPEGGAPLLGFAWSGPNTDLEPEEANTRSLGVDFTPNENTKINLTYWDIEYEKQVTKYLGRLDVLSIEDQLAGTGLILHGTDAGNMVKNLVDQGIPVARGVFPGDDPENVTLYLDGRNRNLGVSITRGFDFQINHNWETDTTGSFLFSLGGTYLTTYEVALSDAGEKVDFLNEIFNPLRFKARGSVTWNYRSFATQFGFRYVNSYDNTAVTPTQSVDSYIPVDIVVRYNADNVDWLDGFGEGFSLSLEARNVFDADPPYVNIAQGSNGGGGFDPTASDPTGRVIAVSLRKSF
jgi:iron complex outermembrane receptor protein